jgi:prepilin-type N-terminal cleavage/methylation domain-containing protein
MRRPRERGVTLVEVATVLAILALGIGVAGVAAERAVPRYRTVGAADDLYAAVHLTRARARASGVVHALVIEPGGEAFRIVADPAGRAQTVAGPQRLVDGVVVAGNSTIRFWPAGYAVPAGTITVRAGDETRRVVVNMFGRVRLEDGKPAH